MLSKEAKESIWLKKSLLLPGMPIPRKNFAKPNILSPGTCNQMLSIIIRKDIQTPQHTPYGKLFLQDMLSITFKFSEVTAAKAVSPRTTEAVVERGL